MKWNLPAAVLAAGGVLLPSGCRSHHLDITVENHTGAEVRLLEVDYPNASFGAESLGPGASMRYRIQVQGNGPVKVQYSTAQNHQIAPVQGPELRQDQDGSLEIVLEPAGKAAFHSNQPASSSH